MSKFTTNNSYTFSYYFCVVKTSDLLFVFISVEYWDIGDPTWMCTLCGAMMWYQERARKDRKSTHPKFSLCCMHGKVKLPLLKNPPPILRRYLENKDAKSRHFVKNIRTFNMMFSFTSMGGKVDYSINQGRGPYVFRLHGQDYHRIWSLLPNTGSSPKFLQLYIHDTDNEVSNRISSIRCGILISITIISYIK